MSAISDNGEGCSDIQVVVSGFRNAKGDGVIAVFAEKTGFPEDLSKAAQRLKAPIENGQSVFEIKGVRPGVYAVVAMHDENQNGKMDHNLLGMPTKGYGMSNDPKIPLFGPPTFELARFSATPGKMNLHIALHY